MADVEVDQHGDVESSRSGSALKFVNIENVVYNNHCVGRLRHDVHQSRPFRLANHLSRYQEAANASAHHHLGLSDRRRADSDRSFFKLTPCDVRAFVGL